MLNKYCHKCYVLIQFITPKPSPDSIPDGTLMSCDSWRKFA